MAEYINVEKPFLDKLRQLKWRVIDQGFGSLNLTNPQKQALIFVREVGAIDNQKYRQMADCDTLKASNELRLLKSFNLLMPKGKGKATYYIAGSVLSTQAGVLSTEAGALSTEAGALSTEPTGLNTEPAGLNTEPAGLSTQDSTLSTQAGTLSTQAGTEIKDVLYSELPDLLKEKVRNIKERENDPAILCNIIIEICKFRAYKSSELAILLNKREDYIRRKFLFSLIQKKEIKYLHPEMIKHPNQAYLTIKKGN